MVHPLLQRNSFQRYAITNTDAAKKKQGLDDLMMAQ
jgi:hypothetical protein